MRRALRSLLWALLSLAVLAGLEKRAGAGTSARLVYGRAPGVDGCPDEAGLRRAIADRVGYDPVFAVAPNDVEVTITRTGDQLTAEVRFVDRNRILVGTRAFQAPLGQCDSIVASIALSVAIALDQLDKTSPPPLAGEPLPAPPAESPPPPTPAEAPARPASVAEREPGSRPRPPASLPPPAKVGVDLAIGMAGWVGVTPAFSFGPTAFTSVRVRRLSLGVEGSWALPSSTANAGSAGLLRTSLIGAGPIACLDLQLYFGCAVAFAGSLRAEAPRVPGAVAQTGIEVLAGVRGGVAIPLARGVSLQVSLDLLGVPYGPTLRVLGDDVWKPSPVAGGAQTVLAWRIP
ncbi:MAG: hypothetical protein FWD17_02985 [Polyangiaceae bacterium]|nr:hypothetical protein [Polyangiaceae bacterium]